LHIFPPAIIYAGIITLFILHLFLLIKHLENRTANGRPYNAFMLRIDH
jgi:hypothetical protein